ncbi:50S ribosomal protein L15 [Candidatus Parcubacteria bacterium]|uniref:Large ribosomal subunit protein uL15 n=1 Tax=Candidatus Kaiserbacteria bacterium CG10_big_fil_rev_8_21_14_0_10_47_16 TaxID=1974608 RepID=A0A2H0UE58_9BACT|nr:50S ribosomal protein L15 [Candidatus Parcubacteria bacterium]PIR84667.1 MAG: 50S ribosomal protein L15 [Candidatus Kaiserbacteria bacterium CG10_big_fil_rev_8_21_14_0_10_47_16]
MTMQLHELKPTTARKVAKRIGRGGKRGKTSGRGMKGQKARAGNSMRPEMRDIIKKLPKLRGHGKNRAKTVNAERPIAMPVNIAALALAFPKGGEVSPKSLVGAGVIRSQRGKAPLVKILGNGEITQKITVTGCSVSASAREKIEKAGGTIV